MWLEDIVIVGFLNKPWPFLRRNSTIKSLLLKASPSVPSRSNRCFVLQMSWYYLDQDWRGKYHRHWQKTSLYDLLIFHLFHFIARELNVILCWVFVIKYWQRFVVSYSIAPFFSYCSLCQQNCTLSSMLSLFVSANLGVYTQDNWSCR